MIIFKKFVYLILFYNFAFFVRNIEYFIFGSVQEIINFDCSNLERYRSYTSST